MAIKSQKTVAQLEEELALARLALSEAKKKKVKEDDNPDEVDVKKDSKKSDDDADGDEDDKKDVKEAADGKEPDVKDDGADAQKIKEAKKKKKKVAEEKDGDEDDKEDDKEDKEDKKEESKSARLKTLMQSYREESQPPVETHGDPLTGPKKLVGESVSVMFDGEELSEGFKKKAATIFEAALTSRVAEEVALIEAAAEKALEHAVTEIEEDLMEKADDYVGYVVSEWLEENKLEVETSLKLEILEGFFDGLKALFVEHNITVPQDKLDILESTKAEVAELTDSANALTEQLIAANKTILELRKADVVAELSEGLAATQVEKLKALVEGIEAKDVETFKEKAGIIRESYFKEAKPEAKKAADGAKVTSETVDPNIQRYLGHAKQHNQ